MITLIFMPPNQKIQTQNVSLINPRRQEICDFLDSFNDFQKFCKVNPSTLLKSGWYMMQKEHKSLNPDWMAQSAHSFREIHYGIGNNKKIPDIFFGTECHHPSFSFLYCNLKPIDIKLIPFTKIKI